MSPPVDPPAFECDVPRAQVRWRWPALGLRWLLVVGGTPLLVFPFAWAAWVALVLWATSRLGGTSATLWRSRPGRVRLAGAYAVLEQGRRRSRVVKVQGGWLEPWRGELVAVLEGERGLRLVAQVRDEGQGRELLRAAGVDEAQQVLRVPLGSLATVSGQGAVFHLLAPVLLGLMGLGPLMAFLQLVRRVQRAGEGWGDLLLYGGVLVGIAAIAAGLGWMLVPGEAIVGRDGVRLRRLWNQRFFGFEQVQSVLHTEHGAQLRLLDGSSIQLPTATFFDRDPGRRDALTRRLRDAMTAWASSSAPALPPSFERQGQSVAAWGEQLRASLGRPSYRDESLEPVDLVQLLEASGAPLEHRVGAALVLGRSALDGESRRRVDQAVTSSAHEPVRRALRLALDGDLDDEGLDLALLDDALLSAPRVRQSTPSGVTPFVPPPRPSR